MACRGSICIATAALLIWLSPACAFDDGLYPDLSGQWLRVNFRKGGQITFDQTKAWGLGQEAPLTPQYQSILEASIADQENGGQGNWFDPTKWSLNRIPDEGDTVVINGGIAGIEDALYDRGVDFRHIAFERRRAVHHRHAGQHDIVL